MSKVVKFIKTIDLYVSSICIAAIVLITLFSIVMRYIFGTPIQWTEEINLALLVGFTFIGSAYAFKDDEHISIDLITDRFGGRFNRVFFIIRQSVLLVVVGYVFVYLGFKLALQAQEKVTTVLNIPYTIIDMTVVIGGTIGIIRILYNFKKYNKKEEYE